MTVGESPRSTHRRVRTTPETPVQAVHGDLQHQPPAARDDGQHRGACHPTCKPRSRRLRHGPHPPAKRPRPQVRRAGRLTNANTTEPPGEISRTLRGRRHRNGMGTVHRPATRRLAPRHVPRDERNRGRPRRSERACSQRVTVRPAAQHRSGRTLLTTTPHPIHTTPRARGPGTPPPPSRSCPTPLNAAGHAPSSQGSRPRRHHPSARKRRRPSGTPCLPPPARPPSRWTKHNRLWGRHGPWSKPPPHQLRRPFRLPNALHAPDPLPHALHEHPAVTHITRVTDSGQHADAPVDQTNTRHPASRAP